MSNPFKVGDKIEVVSGMSKRLVGQSGEIMYIDGEWCEVDLGLSDYERLHYLALGHDEKIDTEKTVDGLHIDSRYFILDDSMKVENIQENDGGFQKNVAKRDNAGKPQLDLLEFPYELQVELVKPLEDGVAKYGYGNWLKGRSTNDLMGCLKRHLAKWNGGQDIDPDSKSGCMHLASVAINAIMLINAMQVNAEKYDDRTKRDKE